MDELIGQSQTSFDVGFEVQAEGSILDWYHKRSNHHSAPTGDWENGGSSSKYLIPGMLLTNLSLFGVPHKPIKVYLNDTLAGTATTYGLFGKFNMTVNMPPANSFRLSGLGYYAKQNLYNAGLKNASRAFMAGIVIGLASVILTSLFGWSYFSRATVITTNVISAVIGTLVSNLVDPTPVADLTKTVIFASLAAIATASAGLHVPFEPIGSTYYIAFFVVSFTAMFLARMFLEGMN